MLYKALHLEDGEDVIIEVRKHWIVFIGYVMAVIFTAFLPLVVFVLSKVFFPDLFVNIKVGGNKEALVLFFYALWILFLWISLFIEWTKYYLDVWYVTEKRIIIVDQKNIFHREVSNVRFEKIQDVTLEVQGFISTLLRFGNVRVQTASENSQEFFMNAVRHPEIVRKVIFSHQNKTGNSSHEPLAGV
ncbi:MAG: hypothetical protein QG579_498 [Patescibacteria group bacterium]|jgi:uncharacterized membrane protein YdbT with pleckstrin-like domain|nr:hypothetical protein [Patescibacteria group bacterium]